MESPRYTHTKFSHPLATLAITFILGILCVELFPAKTYIYVLVGPIASVLCLLSVVRGRMSTAGVFLASAFMLAGGALASIEKYDPANGLKVMLDRGVIAEGESIELTGNLERQPELAPEAVYVNLDVESVGAADSERTATGKVTLLIPLAEKFAAEYENLHLRYGARVRVITTLKRSDTFRNPGCSSFTEYLDRKQLDASGVVKSVSLITRLDDRRVFPPLAWLYDWRQQLQAQINARFAAETAGVLNASILGNRYFLPRSTAEKFREGGTFHVLVISGLHISFIGGLIFILARRISKNRVVQFVSSATVLWGYALAVGADASVVRAALMFTFVAFAPVLGRRGASLNALGAAGLVLLVRRPGDLFDPSFQLTFLSVLAIVVVAWPLLQQMSAIGSWRPTRATPYPPASPRWICTLSEMLYWRERSWRLEMERLNYSYKLFKAPGAAWLERHHLQRGLRYAFAAVLTSVSVQLTLLPLLIVYFHRVSISSVVLNIGISLLMALLIFTGIAALLIAQISISLASPFISVTNALDLLMVHGVDPFARMGLASLRLPEYSGRGWLIYVLFYVPLVFLTLRLWSWNPMKRPDETRFQIGVSVRSAVAVQLVMLSVVVAHPFSAEAPQGNLRIDFLDVGQGDAAFVTLPDGTTLLVDGGGRPSFARKKPDEETFERDSRSIGEAVVSEYLWWRGVDHVDYLIATHADADHIDGLNDVARNFRVRGALVARTPASDPEFSEFAATLNNQGVPLFLIGSDDQLQFEQVSARVLWPRPRADSQAASFNNDSIVLRLDFEARSILLLADIENAGEAALLADLKRTGNESSVHADVVKVAHHGSKTSSTADFVNATRAQLAVISVGRHSMFGHPHRSVVERWRAAGAEILTTGESGTITVTTDGRDLQVRKFVN